MKDILNNPKHIGIISRYIKVSKAKGKDLTIAYITQATRDYLFPEYREDPDLAEKIKVISNIQ